MATSGHTLIGKKLASFYDRPDRYERTRQALLTKRTVEGREALVRSDGQRLSVSFKAAASRGGLHLFAFQAMSIQSGNSDLLKDSANANSAWICERALRDATLAITEDLRMGDLLTTCLETLSRFVPYDAAQILLTDSTGKLFVAQEFLPFGEKGHDLHCRRTLELAQYPILHEALESKSGKLVLDTFADPLWRTYHDGPAVRSWIGVRIDSAEHTMGLIMVSRTLPGSFTPRHLKMTNCLAVTSALAVQKGRLLERSKIYAAELERCLSASKSRLPEKF